MNSTCNHLECLQEIARLNNEGARYLASNVANDGVKALKSALVIMGGIADTVDMMMDCESESQKSNDCCPSLEVPGLEDVFFIYNRAVLLDPSETSDLSATNAIILFNLALAFHQRGLLCGQEAKLGKAVHLYDLCTKLVYDVSSSLGPLILAALNNQAQIYYSMGDYAKVEEQLQVIRSVAEYVTMPRENTRSSSNTNVNKPAFEQRHFEEIYLNVAITQPPTTAASA